MTNEKLCYQCLTNLGTSGSSWIDQLAVCPSLMCGESRGATDVRKVISQGFRGGYMHFAWLLVIAEALPFASWIPRGERHLTQQAQVAPHPADLERLYTATRARRVNIDLYPRVNLINNRQNRPLMSRAGFQPTENRSKISFSREALASQNRPNDHLDQLQE